MRHLFLAISLLIVMNACGRQHSNNRTHRDSQSEFPNGNLLVQKQNIVEQMIVDILNQDLSTHKYAKTTQWTTRKDDLTVHEKLEAEASGKIKSISVNDVKKIAEQKFDLAFDGQIAISKINVRYFADDKLIASLSNVDIPVKITATIHVDWELAKNGSIQFVSTRNSRYLSNLKLEATDFEYQGTLTKDLGPAVKATVKNEAEKLINHILSDKEGSILATLNADLNKLKDKDKLELTGFVAKAADKYESGKK